MSFLNVGGNRNNPTGPAKTLARPYRVQLSMASRTFIKTTRQQAVEFFVTLGLRENALTVARPKSTANYDGIC